MRQSSRFRIGVALVLLALAPAGMGGAQTLPRTPELPPIGCRRITQADIDANRPYTITQPGRYCLVENIQVPYTRDRNTTIEVAASDVTLLFLGYSLTQVVGDNASGTTAIGVRGNLRNVVISGGTIGDFGTGVGASGGWVLRLNRTTGRAEYIAQPLLGLQVTDMHFTGLVTGVELRVGSMPSGRPGGAVQASRVERNRFDNSLFGVYLEGDVTGTEVCDNHFFMLGSGPGFVTNSGFQMGIYGRPYGAVIRDNTFTGNDQLPLAGYWKYGVFLYHGDHSVIEGNHFLRLSYPIILGGSQRASNNVIRSNRIYGDSPWALYMGPLTTATPAIYVANNENLTVEGNVIHSGPAVGYDRGIQLRDTTVSTQPSGLPGVFDNETCNVDVDLDPASADGGNFWDTCNLPN